MASKITLNNRGFSRDSDSIEAKPPSLSILHLCRKIINESHSFQDQIEPLQIIIPHPFSYDRVVDIQGNLPHLQSRTKIEDLISNGWVIVEEDLGQHTYRTINTGPNKGENLLTLFMSDLLKKAIQEESLSIEVADHCVVELAHGSYVVLRKSPLQSREEFLEALRKLPPQQQFKIAQDLCRLICKTGFLHVRTQDLRIQDGKLLLTNLRPCGLLRDISEENPRFFPHVDECAQVGLHILLQDLGRNHTLFRHAARKALSMQKDKGLESDSALEKLDFFKATIENPTSTKRKKLAAFRLLPQRLQEYFEFLAWAGMGKPVKDTVGKKTILVYPEILNEIKNFQGQSLIDQVKQQLQLRQQLLLIQQALMTFKAELLQKDSSPEVLLEKFNQLLDDFSKDFIFFPLQNKLEQLIGNQSCIQGAKQVFQNFLTISSSGSSYCVLDQLIMTLQDALVELSINGSKHRIRNQVNRNIPSRPTSKKQIEAQRFDMTIPKELIQKRLKVVLIAYECAKFAVKFGGLGEAVYGMAKGLAETGHQVSLVLPKSDVIPSEISQELKERSGTFSHDYKNQKKTDSFYICNLEEIQLFYLEDTDPIEGKDHYYLGHRANIYKDGILEDPREKWYGLKERMLYFSSAAAALIKTHRKMCDLLVVNDWHGADAMRHLIKQKIPSVFVIHNNGYGAQGVFDGVSAEIPGFFGHTSKGTNILLDALSLADHVVTVSPNFALEMQGRILDAGIGPFVREIAYLDKFTGIVNGSNPDLWDPSTNLTLKEWKELQRTQTGEIILSGKIIDLTYRATDPHIFAIKNQIKQQLQLAIEKYYPEAYEEFRIDVTGDVLLSLGRYDSSQKGLDKLLPVIKAARKQNIAVLIMGVGEDPEATRILDELEAHAREHKGVWVTRGKEDNASLKIQLGSKEIPPLGPLMRSIPTFNLMPSSFEPCGLFQLEGFLNGVPVIATATGGIPDTVNTDKTSPHFNGVLFERLENWYSDEQDELAVQAVIEAFQFWRELDEESKRLITMNMMQDAKRAGWTSSPSGLTPVEQYQRVFAAATKNVNARQKKIVDIKSPLENPCQEFGIDHYFGQGSQYFLYHEFGAHLVKENGAVIGVRFQLLAPNAVSVKLLLKTARGDQCIPLQKSDQMGVWTLFQKGLQEGSIYEYCIETPTGQILYKADPFAFQSQLRPEYRSIVADPDAFTWSDQEWMQLRAEKFGQEKKFPLNIYEVHLPSFKRDALGNFVNYRELADILVQYCKKMQFTHIELLGLFEYPNDDSWGYQTSGYFSPTSRNGTLQDFQYFVNAMHQAQIGVIVDWAPFHFCTDTWSLSHFDGSALFEETDPFNGISPDGWGTHVFDISKQDVRNFLISSAMFAFDKLHLDGLRVDAVTHLIDLSWGRHEFTPTSADAGALSLHGIEMLKEFNQSVHTRFPDVLTIAENWSLSAPDTTPIHQGGYGFDRRWGGSGNMIQEYLAKGDEERKRDYSNLKNIDKFIADHKEINSIGHDEIVPHKKSLFGKPPANSTLVERFASARLYLSSQALLPNNGILTFMGCEFAQKKPWSHHQQIHFDDLEQEPHKQVHKLTKTIHKFYNSQPTFWSTGTQGNNFEWLDQSNDENLILAYHRKDLPKHQFLVIHNFSNKPVEKYTLLFHQALKITEILNTDDAKFGGSGEYINNSLPKISEEEKSIQVKIAPLSTIVFQEDFDTPIKT
jgi:1,4-alpha-glucan branching enzyme